MRTRGPETGEAEAVMDSVDTASIPGDTIHPEKQRMAYGIVLESLLVLVVGLVVWGVLWDLGYGQTGLIVATILWAILLPALEIATIIGYRRQRGE